LFLICCFSEPILFDHSTHKIAFCLSGQGLRQTKEGNNNNTKQNKPKKAIATTNQKNNSATKKLFVSFGCDQLLSFETKKGHKKSQRRRQKAVSPFSLGVPLLLD
jgi:hypothetical protein